MFLRTTLAPDNPNFLSIYVNPDESPASGFEAFAVALSYHHFLDSWWHACPITYLGFGCMTVRHKAFQLLWVFFLETGASAELMRYRCDAVKAFTTDRGTERLMCGRADVLLPFLRIIGVPTDG